MTSKISYLISKPLITVNKGTRGIEAAKKMAEHNIGSLVIMDNDKLYGIITERDIIKALGKGISLDSPVEEIGTTKNLITINDEDTVYKAAELMAKYNIRHLIVTNKEGKLVGIISIRDLIRESHVLKALSITSEQEWIGSD
ncbi:CBS domain-containing protein [Acidianus sulfidivorans JP7]|uniref:Histidine kinase n=1 Tax=Acidianus sulfidivorans JP7 TaxID=619593 RepID=A0A2U9IJV0_9CREN|nr:CBS domain-containing protein [Acidianus sulfidivorans]AWR96321.1 CBS domain-containing protein [Acidianus sulfidivorans JP7]